MEGSRGRFVWYELATTEPGRAQAFYAAVLGWGTLGSVRETGYSVFTVGEGAVGGLMALPEPARQQGAEPRWLGYVEVDDVETTAAQVKQLGGGIYVPPTEIANVSRFAIVTDPQGAGLALLQWLSPEQRRFALAEGVGGVIWHELLAADAEKAFAFYADLFGWQKGESIPGATGIYQCFGYGGETLGGIVKKPPLAAPFWLYYFNAGDLDAAAERVTAHGGQIFYGPADLTGGGSSILHCLDPQGAMFGLSGKRSYKARIVIEQPGARDSLSWRKRSPG